MGYTASACAPERYRKVPRPCPTLLSQRRTSLERVVVLLSQVRMALTCCPVSLLPVRASLPQVHAVAAGSPRRPHASTASAAATADAAAASPDAPQVMHADCAAGPQTDAGCLDDDPASARAGRVAQRHAHAGPAAASVTQAGATVGRETIRGKSWLYAEAIWGSLGESRVRRGVGL